MELDDGKFGLGINVSRNLSLSVLADFEELCFLDNAKGVA